MVIRLGFIIKKISQNEWLQIAIFFRKMNGYK